MKLPLSVKSPYCHCYNEYIDIFSAFIRNWLYGFFFVFLLPNYCFMLDFFLFSFVMFVECQCVTQITGWMWSTVGILWNCKLCVWWVHCLRICQKVFGLSSNWRATKYLYCKVYLNLSGRWFDLTFLNIAGLVRKENEMRMFSMITMIKL